MHRSVKSVLVFPAAPGGLVGCLKRVAEGFNGDVPSVVDSGSGHTLGPVSISRLPAELSTEDAKEHARTDRYRQQQVS